MAAAPRRRAGSCDQRRGARNGALTTLLLLPAGLWYLMLLVLPLVIVVVFSFGKRPRTAATHRPSRSITTPRRSRSPEPFITSLWLAIAGTILCLLAALPLAYFIATRGGARKAPVIILLVIPFWTSFLIRTYAWLIAPRARGPRRVHRRR